MNTAIRDAWRAAWAAGAGRIEAARGRDERAREAAREAVELAAVRAAVEAGGSDSDVSELTGWTTSVARLARKKLGLASRWAPTATWEARARPLYEAGATADDLAAALGWGRRTCQTRISELRALDRARAAETERAAARVKAAEDRADRTAESEADREARQMWVAAEEERAAMLRAERNAWIRAEMQTDLDALLDAGPANTVTLARALDAAKGPASGIRYALLVELLRAMESAGKIQREGAQRGRFGRWVRT